ncbi:MAG TPA: PKD domain-containing protein [Kribbellaceae bacterium]
MGAQIRALKKDVHANGVDRRKEDQFQRRSTKTVRTEKPLSLQEKARVLALKRAKCLAALREASRLYRIGATGSHLSADHCSIIKDPVKTQPVVITSEVVLTEVKRVRFPSSVVHIQPRGRTLVNLDTYVYADPKLFDKPVPIAGQIVRIRATPSYTWHFGDGTSLTTADAGGPYPDGDVTHKYLSRGTVVVSVTLDYDTWYQLPGADWEQAGTVEIPGPGTPLLVCEAKAVLTDPDNPEPYDTTPASSDSCS